jgi:ATP synthase F0 subunit c
MDSTGLIALGAGIAAMGVVGGAIGIGMIGSKAVEAVARQPEAKGDITSTMIISMRSQRSRRFMLDRLHPADLFVK